MILDVGTWYVGAFIYVRGYFKINMRPRTLLYDISSIGDEDVTLPKFVRTCPLIIEMDNISEWGLYV